MSHDLRKTQLNKMCKEDNLPVLTVKKYARHQKYESTMRYVGMEEDEMISDLIVSRKKQLIKLE
jgi:hypothetical protein